jgi:hypothetical protein
MSRECNGEKHDAEDSNGERRCVSIKNVSISSRVSKTLGTYP